MLSQRLGRLPYEEQERRAQEALEVCRALAQLYDSSVLRIEYSDDGFPPASEDGFEYHALVTPVKLGISFPLFVTHDAPEFDHDLPIQPGWCHGLIRWLPIDLDREVRESLVSAYEQWADRQWANHERRVAPVVRLPEASLSMAAA
jgi:hypothetical protein